MPKSRSAEVSRIRAILVDAHAKHGESILPTDSEAHAALLSVLESHPRKAEKVGIGLLGFLVRPARFGGGLQVFVARTDGSFIDMSWQKYVDGHAPTQAANTAAAMRKVVTPLILDFLRKTPTKGVACELCSLPIIEPTHVDHVRTFKSLAEEYAVMAPAILSHPIVPDDDDYGVKFKDPGAPEVAGWSRFHAENATLRIVHAACNLKKGAAK